MFQQKLLGKLRNRVWDEASGIIKFRIATNIAAAKSRLGRMDEAASEFVEALRGKGDPIEEAGDVIIAFLALVDNYGLPIDEILSRMEDKMAGMENKLGSTLPYLPANDIGMGNDVKTGFPIFNVDTPDLPTVGSLFQHRGYVYRTEAVNSPNVVAELLGSIGN